MTPAEVARAVAVAAHRLRCEVVATPVVASPWLSAATGRDVRCKLENEQTTGSFKLRGAVHALLAMPAGERQAGVVAASSGNHGLALATAGRRLGVPVTVYVPTTTPADKQARIAAAGAEVRVHGADCVLAEAEARAVAAATGRRYVSPYNDADVIAGQGTVMVELLAQWPEVETVYVAVGGGGLFAGIAAYGKAQRPDLEVVACSPSASAAMAACVRAGAIVDVACGPTLSDSTAGGVEPGALTFPLCRDLADRWLDVGEPAIAAAMRAMHAEQGLRIEGAAGVAVAGCLADARARGRRSAVIVCGGNVSAAARAIVAGG